MKFDKAYCSELDRSITPYLARELFFDEDSQYYDQKLSFKCEDQSCRVELIGVNIYNPKKPKKALHFRTKQNLIHNTNPKCIFYLNRNEVQAQKGQRGKSEENFKLTKYPSVFLLERPKKKPAVNGTKIIDIEDYENFEREYTKVSKLNGSTTKTSVLETSCLENIVDCYLHGDKIIINSQLLTIGEKTKVFNNFFKRVKYFMDEKGLIYWGEVKEIKRYGNNYRIIFTDKAKIEDRYLSISIYIEDELIQKYKKRKMFREQLDSLIEIKETVFCFFVGAYPEIVEIAKGDIRFDVIDVKVTNLNHIAFTFD